MPFVQVDPSQIDFDAPQGSAPQGFVAIDPSKIQFDKPKASTMDNIISFPAQLTKNAVETGGQALDIAKNAATSIGQTESAPLDTSNPLATAGDLGGRAASIAGNTIRTITSPAEAVLRNDVFQPGGIVSRNVTPAIVNTLFKGQGIPQAQLDQIANNPQTTKAFQDTASNAVTQSSLMAATPRQTNLIDMANENPGGWQSGPPPGGGGGVPPSKTTLTPEMLDTAKRAAYKAVDSANTGFTPAFTNKTLAVLENSKQPAIAGKVLTSENADINSALGEYADLKDTPLTLKDYQQIDSTLGNKAAEAYIAGKANKGRILSDAQDSIREMVKPENLNPQDITGSPEGINTLTQHAIPMWSTSAKMADITKIIDRANAMPNPPTAMSTGFRNLMLNKGKMAQYPPEIQRLITKAAVNGDAADLLGVIGSRLNPIVAGAAGGPAAAVVAQGTSKFARVIGNRMANNKADAVVNSMLENVRPSIEKFATKP